MKILHGDCLEKLKELPDNSIDSVVTDPPYGLSFMGKKWDYDVPSEEIWRECLRVLKPGGHLLSFAGSRTYHRMAVRIEDAGFEIRDMIAWVYGSGFPKSLNIGKAVDKINGELGRKQRFTEWMRTTGITAGEINKITNSFMGSHYLTAKEQPAIPTAEIWAILRPHIKVEIPQWVDELVERIEREREVIGEDTKARSTSGKSALPTVGGETVYESWNITKGTSEWEGWGTALKPAHEPICMARKPLSEKTVAENCLKWGTGGINIEASKVGTETTRTTIKDLSQAHGNQFGKSGITYPTQGYKENTPGRFPANLIHDGSEEVLECFPNESERFFKSIIYTAKASKKDRDEGLEGFELHEPTHGKGHETGGLQVSNSKNPKANNHPTVKPTALMRYLVKLVTPPGGTVLDPFAGSGSTGKACKLEGFDFIGIEREEEYVKIAEARIEAAKQVATLL